MDDLSLYLSYVRVGLEQVLKEEELQTKGLVLLVDARDVGLGLLRHVTSEYGTVLLYTQSAPRCRNVFVFLLLLLQH